MRRKIGKLGKFCLYNDGYVECEEEIEKRTYSPAYGSFDFVYGPSAGGLMESVRLDIITFGEYIRNVIVNPYYKSRTIKIKGKGINDALLYIERINAPFTASHTIAFLMAIEKALGIEVPYELLLDRIAEIELERIRNNLLVIERLTESAGFQVPMNSLLWLVEKVNRIIGKYFGHRYFFGVNYYGGINVEEGKIKDLEIIEKEFNDLFNSLIESRIFIDRLQGNGIIKDEESIGPVARAANLEYDARNEEIGLPYKDLEFKISTYDSADAFGRFIVRGKEIFESLNMLSRINLKKIEYKGKLAEGKAIGRVESPSGDLAYYVEVSNEGKISEIYLLSPSSVNIKLFSKSMVKNIFTDLPFNWESFGIWISEIGVKFE
ncbi:formate hydrogenlyase [Acidianus hospitalis]|uniref:Formate hydrogenlyase n=1 Tax=Acidianus hospitalis TaxID=563177 RepID=A0A2T9X2C2_9CREN|nr:formate hydrogenlyase [Acidianus hospitalis]